MRPNSINPGDRVAFSKAWLRSIGTLTGRLPFARGTVTKIDSFGEPLALATVDWGDDEIPARVLVAHLVKVQCIPHEAE